MKKIVVAGNIRLTQKIIALLSAQQDKYEVSAVCGKSAKNPVITYCKEHNIEYTIPDLSEKPNNALAEYLHDKKTDLMIVSGYGKILAESVLQIPRFGCINTHVSLLPDLRGATPVQSAIARGYEQTGLTIQKMVKQMDAGDILAQYPVTIDINDNYSMVMDKMIDVIQNNLLDFLIHYFDHKIQAIPQDHEKATFCHIQDFSRDNARLVFTKSSFEIHDMIRACNPEPLAWTIINLNGQNKILNILSTYITTEPSTESFGTIYRKDKKLYLSTSDNDLIINELVLEGKKPMKGEDFANGYLKDSKIQLL